MRTISVVLLTAWTAVVLQPAVSSWNFQRHETARIRAHLERIEGVLRARDVTSLAPAQQQARARCLDALRAYRTAGEFPHNHDFPASREPYFVDRHGTRCAMAELIERAGGASLVQRVAADANNARVRELAGDPELVAWLDQNGMTAEEAAWVQPAYDSPPFNDYVARSQRKSHGAAHAAAIAAGITGVGLNGMHRISPGARRAAIVFGVAAAGAGLIIGGTLIEDDLALGLVDIGVGMASLMAAVHNYNHLDPEPEIRTVWRASPALRVSREGVPQLAVSVGF